MKVSIRQLAEHCGVSVGTVDRVLNNRAGVKQQTREQVEKAVKELGYTTNYLAKSLSVGRTSSIGIVLFHLKNLFFAQMSDAMVKQADSSGYFSYLTLSEKNRDKEYACVRTLAARQVDGIVLFSTNQSPEFIDYISSMEIPVVTVMTELAGVPSVKIDDFSAMRDAANYIASKNYHRIIYVSPPLSHPEMNIKVQTSRHEGFLNAVKGWSVEAVVIRDDDFLERIDQLNITDVKTAILCSSDVYAIEVMSHLRLKGILTPYHYGLMGFDNIGVLRHIEPLITTVSVPIEDVGRRAVEMLIQIIEGNPTESQLLPYKIVPGQTIV